MSLITRCPACGTMFKVVPDQLRISEGWVRCGHCAEIFDATASLQGADAAESLQHAAAPEPAQRSPDSEPAWPSPSPSRAPAPTPAPPPPPPQPSAPIRAEAQDSIDAPPLYPSFPSEVHDSQLQREPREEEPDLDDVSFVRHARRKAFWRRPLVSLALLLLVLVLGVSLVLQYAAHDRDKLAATEPALRPWLQLLCEPLRCQVGPPRQIDAIVIDSSSFSRLRSDAYRLSFTVRNQAATQVAMPSIELTLTDTQDQPVIRRVLAPRELGVPTAIAAASESTGSVALSVTASGISGRIAGYRLLAFYP